MHPFPTFVISTIAYALSPSIKTESTQWLSRMNQIMTDKNMSASPSKKYNAECILTLRSSNLDNTKLCDKVKARVTKMWLVVTRALNLIFSATSSVLTLTCLLIFRTRRITILRIKHVVKFVRGARYSISKKTLVEILPNCYDYNGLF